MCVGQGDSFGVNIISPPHFWWQFAWVCYIYCVKEARIIIIITENTTTINMHIHCDPSVCQASC